MSHVTVGISMALEGMFLLTWMIGVGATKLCQVMLTLITLIHLPKELQWKFHKVVFYMVWMYTLNRILCNVKKNFWKIFMASPPHRKIGGILFTNVLSKQWHKKVNNERFHFFFFFNLNTASSSRLWQVQWNQGERKEAMAGRVR